MLPFQYKCFQEVVQYYGYLAVNDNEYIDVTIYVMACCVIDDPCLCLQCISKFVFLLFKEIKKLHLKHYTFLDLYFQKTGSVQLSHKPSLPTEQASQSKVNICYELIFYIILK